MAVTCSINRKLVPVKAMYFVYIGALVSLFPSLPVYLAYLGLSVTQIGLIRGAEPLLDFIVSPIWGYLADTYSAHKPIMIINIIGVGVFFSGMLLVPGVSSPTTNNFTNASGIYIPTTPQPDAFEADTMTIFVVSMMLIGLGQCCNAAVVPIQDANTMEIVKGDDAKQSYGRQRLWGSAGGIIFSVSVGLLLDWYAKQHVSFLHEYLPAFVIFGCLILLTLIPASQTYFPPHTPNETYFKNMGRVLKKPRISMFLLVMCTFGFSYGQDSFKYLFLDDELQSDHLTRALCPAFNCIGEIFFMWNSKWIIKKVGYERVFYATLVAWATRFIVYSVIVNPWLILPVEVLHGICFGLLWPNVTTFCNEVAPPGMAATLQAIAFALYAGLSEAVGTMFGGFFYDSYGPRNLFRCMAAINVTMLAIYVTFNHFYQEPEQSEDDGKENKAYLAPEQQKREGIM